MHKSQISFVPARHMHVAAHLMDFIFYNAYKPFLFTNGTPYMLLCTNFELISFWSTYLCSFKYTVYDSQYIAAVPHKYHVRIFTLAIWRTELLIVVIRIHRPRRFKCLLVQALSHPLTVEHNR